MIRANVSPWRMRVLMLIFAGAVVLLMLRLLQVQILDHQRFEAEARDIHFWTETVQGARGAILDRNGFPLVTGIDQFEIHVDREAWELDQDNERFAVQQLSRLLAQRKNRSARSWLRGAAATRSWR